MKAQILKIAGVKSEKDFYKKFPTEEAFMAKHGGDFKKAQVGYNTPPIDNSLAGYPGYQPIVAPPPMMDDSIYNPTLSSGLPTYNPNSDANYTIAQNQQITQATPIAADAPLKGMDAFGKGLPIVGNLIGGIQAFEAGKEKRKQAEQMKKVSEIALKASTTRPEQIARRYVRPEDNVFATSQLFPANGVGTNVLAKNGVKLKEYQTGGGLPSGFGENPYGNLAGSFFDNNGGSQIGGAIGSVFGPVGGVAGSLIGGALDTNGRRAKKAQEATMRNVMNMGLNNMAPAVQAGYASYMEDGGELSLMEDGGQLQTHWGGNAKPISYNPFLPDSGETVMFNGDSHADGGIGMTYGKNKVEVEGGEPAVQLPDGEGVNLTVFGKIPITKDYAAILGDKSATGKQFKNYVANISKTEDKQNQLVGKTSEELDALSVITPFDKLKLSSLQANLTGANMKLKMAADKKINAAHLQEAINQTADENGLSPEHLAKGKLKKAKDGYTMKAQTGVTTDPNMDLYYKTKGINPGSIDYNTPEQTGNAIFQGDSYFNTWRSKVLKALSDPTKAKEIINRLETYDGQDSADVRNALTTKGSTFNDKVNRTSELTGDQMIGPYHNLVDLGRARRNDIMVAPAATTPNAEQVSPVEETVTPFEKVDYNRSKLMDVYNMVLPYVRPTDQEPLDANQLVGEMYAMSNNQVDPVQAQGYQPDLGTPFDVTFQEQINEVTAQTRAAQKMAQGNPGAQAIIAGGAYGAYDKIKGEELRTNLTNKFGVYGDNRKLLNDAKLKNLDIYDRQYVRQSQAVSNSKATTQAALNSIGDKYAKNKLENRTLGVYENMYNYRYDDSGRAINLNGLFQANIPQAAANNNGVAIQGPNGTTLVPQYKNGKLLGYFPENKATTTTDVGNTATPPYTPIGSRRTSHSVFYYMWLANLI